MARLGRPPKYDIEIHPEKIVELMGQGYSIEGACGAMELHRDTHYAWIKQHSEYSDAVNLAIQKSAQFYDKLGVNAMAGKLKGFVPSVWIFTRKNLHKWKDRHEVSTEDNKPIELKYSVDD